MLPGLRDYQQISCLLIQTGSTSVWYNSTFFVRAKQSHWVDDVDCLPSFYKAGFYLMQVTLTIVRYPKQYIFFCPARDGGTQATSIFQQIHFLLQTDGQW